MIWLRMGGQYFCDRAGPAVPLHAVKRLVGVSPFRRPIRLSPTDEAPNCTATLDNGDGALTDTFKDVLLNEVEIGVDERTVVRGVITAVRGGAQIDLQVEG